MSRLYHAALARSPSQRAALACVAALIDDATSAVRFLDATAKNGMPDYPAFSRDKCFDKVRGTPQFVQFMAQLKPVWEEYQRRMR